MRSKDEIVEGSASRIKERTEFTFAEYVWAFVENEVKAVYNLGFLAGRSEGEQTEPVRLKEAEARGYEAGICETWEIAKEVLMMRYEEGGDVQGAFGKDFSPEEFFEKLTAKEAVLKIKEYRKTAKETLERMISVGDEVIFADAEFRKQSGKGVVLRVKDGDIDVMWANGHVGSMFHADELVRTGKKYDVSDILRNLGEK